MSPGIKVDEGDFIYVEAGYNNGIDTPFDPKCKTIFVGPYKIVEINDGTLILQNITLDYSPVTRVSRNDLNKCKLSSNRHDENVGMPPGLYLGLGYIFYVKAGNDLIPAGTYKLEHMLSPDKFVLCKGCGSYPSIIIVSRDQLNECTLSLRE